MSSDHHLAAGSVIADRYHLNRELGEGAFGVVYAATQLSTGQSVALKVLQHPPNLSAEQMASCASRFTREMQLIGQLHHPHVVRLVDSGALDDGRMFMVLELVQGTDLADLIHEKGAMPVEQAQHLMFQVLDALCYAHDRGIVHRDLKPENVMVSSAGYRPSATVLDFGVAAITQEARDQDYRTLTIAGMAPGTPWYMPPEQLAGDLTPQSDIYAWGIVFLECLTGQCPIDAETPLGAIAEQVSPDPVPMPPWLQGTPLGNVLARATAKRREERFETARETIQALEAAVAGPSSTSRMQRPTPSQLAARKRTLAEEAKSDSGVPLWLAIVLAVLLLAGGTVATAWFMGWLPGADSEAVERGSGDTPDNEEDRSEAEEEADEDAEDEDEAEAEAEDDGAEEEPLAEASPEPAPEPRGNWSSSEPAPTPEAAPSPEPSTAEEPASPVEAPPQPACPEGQHMLHGTCKQLPADAVKDLEACNARDAASCERLGNNLSTGSNNVPADGAAGFALLERACDMGISTACLSAASLAFQGSHGATRNMVEANDLQEKGCHAGAFITCCSLGMQLATGAGVRRDLERGKTLLETGCKGGVPTCCESLEQLPKPGTL